MMKWTILLALVGVVAAAPGNTNSFNPMIMRMVMDIMKKMQSGGVKMPPMKPLPPTPPQMPFIAPQTFNPPPTQARRQNFMPPPMSNPGPRAGGGGGLFADVPVGRQGYPMMPMTEYCPPHSLSDHCKEQKLSAALWFPDGTPRYNWVPMRNPYDTSISDNLKDMAKNMLFSRVRGRRPSPKEMELMSILGDAKDFRHFGIAPPPRG